MIVYMATCKTNGKKYVGQTVQTFAARKRDHRSNARSGRKGLFYNALRKHGDENFTWEILCTADSIEELNAREIYFIAAYETLAHKRRGYNILSGGGNSKKPLSTRQKISEALMGKVRSSEHCANISVGLKGTKHTAEARVRMGAARKGEKAYQLDRKVYPFLHPEYGEEPCTRYDLREKYGLSKGCLWGVVTGRRKSHKGWRLAV